MLKAIPPFSLPYSTEQMLEHFCSREDLDRVFDLAQETLRRNPHHLPSYDALGAAYFQRGDVGAALRVLSTLIRLDPLNPVHHFKKALLCQHQGEIMLAVEAFVEVCRIEPEGPYADAARDCLYTLDMHQMQQIFVLAVDDLVFRTQVLRDPEKAVSERGYLLSPSGNQMLHGFLLDMLTECPYECRPAVYN